LRKPETVSSNAIAVTHPESLDDNEGLPAIPYNDFFGAEPVGFV